MTRDSLEIVITAASLALVAGAAGYLCCTDRGRKATRRFEHWVNESRDEAERLARVIDHTVKSAAEAYEILAGTARRLRLEGRG